MSDIEWVRWLANKLKKIQNEIEYERKNNSNSQVLYGLTRERAAFNEVYEKAVDEVIEETVQRVS